MGVVIMFQSCRIYLFIYFGIKLGTLLKLNAKQSLQSTTAYYWTTHHINKDKNKDWTETITTHYWTTQHINNIYSLAETTWDEASPWNPSKDIAAKKRGMCHIKFLSHFEMLPFLPTDLHIGWLPFTHTQCVSSKVWLGG